MEAARIDGASEIRLFFKVVLPLGLPAIASLAIFQVLFVWNDLLIGLMLAQSNQPIAPHIAHAAAPVRVEPRRARACVVLLGRHPADDLRALPALLRPGTARRLGQVAPVVVDLRPRSTTGAGERSVEVIRDGQAPSGAYVASPTFPPYRFSWLRDGSFIADAMSRGRRDRERRGVLRLGRARASSRASSDPRPAHRTRATRSTARTSRSSEWPNLQHDGFGLWLWALPRTRRRHDVDLERWARRPTSPLVPRPRAWREPCTDWWEEREGVHAATLACVWAGLAAWSDAAADDVARLHRRLDDARLDASLLRARPAAGPPRRAVALRAARQPRRRRTSPPGRHLLRRRRVAAADGAPRLDARPPGDRSDARTALEWVAAHATAEAVSARAVAGSPARAGGRGATGSAKWGPPPCPLLWSHAMFLTLAHELDDA